MSDMTLPVKNYPNELTLIGSQMCFNVLDELENCFVRNCLAASAYKSIRSKYFIISMYFFLFFSVKNAICLSLRANMLNDPPATTFSPPENQLESPSVKPFGLFEHCGLVLELWRNDVVW